MKTISLIDCLIFSILIVILIIRTFYGVDFSDEMQYAGEIVSLLNEDKLFVSDLFIQQFCYILIYPLFKLYNLFYGTEGLILFTRSILSVMLLGVFFFTRKMIVNTFAYSYSPSLLACAMTFTIVYHNIYALSYNTMSQSLWVVFLLCFWKKWNNEWCFYFSIITAVALICHPLSGVSMAILFCGRSAVEKKYSNVTYFLATVTLFLFLIFTAFSSLYTFPDIARSLAFSKEYSLMALFNNVDQVIMMIFVLLSFAIILYFPRIYLIKFFRVELSIAVAGVCLIYMIKTALFVYPPPMMGIWPKLSLAFMILMLTIMGLLFSFASNEKLYEYRWLAGGILLHSLTLSIISGNGFAQTMGASWVGIVLLTAALLNVKSHDGVSLRIMLLQPIFSIIVVSLFIFHCFLFPYRSTVWSYATEHFSGTGILKFIRITSHQNQVLQKYSAEIGGLVLNKRVLVASQYPVLNLTLDIKPSTCMLFMHSIQNLKVFNILKSCILNKNPEATLHIVPMDSEFNEHEPYTGRLISELNNELGLGRCTLGKLSFPEGEPWTTHEGNQAYKLCQH